MKSNFENKKYKQNFRKTEIFTHQKQETLLGLCKFLLSSTVGCVDCKLKFFYAQNIQEHATGDGSQFVTTRHAVPCSGRRVGAACPHG